MRLIFAVLASLTLSAPALAQESPRDIWAPEMEALGFLVGDYQVTGEVMSDGVWQTGEPTQASIHTDSEGAILVEQGRYAVPGFEYGLYAVYSYDGFRDVYRIMLADTVYGLMDIYEGAMSEDGVLEVSNTRVGTSFPLANEQQMYLRFIITPTDTGHVFLIEANIDLSEVWFPLYRFTYVRQDG